MRYPEIPQCEALMAKKSVKSADKPPRRNMRAAQREQFIVDEAVKFFAEQGFGGQTRELAKPRGSTFKTKWSQLDVRETFGGKS